MRVEIKGRHVTITPALRQLIDARVAQFERKLNDAALSMRVVFTKDKYRLLTEIVLHTRGDHVMRGDGEAGNWPLSVKQAAEKIEQQARRLKGKWNGRKRGAMSTAAAAPAPAAERAEGPRIIRNRRYAVKPMSIEDAALQLAGGAETFVVFRNADTDDEAITILYRRKDGNLGLIEPD
jgi:putative sigma-54 modulation protein